jgi:hypothetical protein
MTIYLYITEFINDPEKFPYKGIDSRLLPYLPYFITKDCQLILFNNKPQNNLTSLPNYYIRPKPSTKRETVENLIRYSMKYPVYLQMTPGRHHVTHHFVLYNGKICSTWGGGYFYVYYNELEITADDLWFLMKFNNDTNEGDFKRYKRLVENYLLNIELFGYAQVYKTVNLPDEELVDLFSEKINPIMSLIYLEKDNSPEEIAFLQEDASINSLLEREQDNIRKLYSNFGIELGSVRDVFDRDKNRQIHSIANRMKYNRDSDTEDDEDGDGNEMSYEEEEEEREDGEENNNLETRRYVLNKLLNVYGITEKKTINKIFDEYIEGIENGVLNLSKIKKREQMMNEKEEAVMLYNQLHEGRLTKQQKTRVERQLQENQFYREYDELSTSIARGNIIGCVLYSNVRDTNTRFLYFRSIEYNYNQWEELLASEIIQDFSYIGVTGIPEYIPVTTNGEYYGYIESYIDDNSPNEYNKLMQAYNNNVPLIVEKLNTAYREMGLLRPVEQPILMQNTECLNSCEVPSQKSIAKEKSPRKLKKMETIISSPIEPPAPAPFVSQVPQTFSVGTFVTTRRPVTRSMARVSKGITKRRRKNRRKTKRRGSMKKHSRRH